LSLDNAVSLVAGLVAVLAWGSGLLRTLPVIGVVVLPVAAIASLLPSATEIVCALGAGDQLVGISHECDFPQAIRDRPVLTRSRIDSTGTSRAIDAAVRSVIAGALSIYDVDAERLSQLSPDVIVTQDLCEVCAVSLDDVRAAVARLAHRDDIVIVSLSPTRLDDVLGDIERVAAALGCPARRRGSVSSPGDRRDRPPRRPRPAAPRVSPSGSIR
jgi:iron complex transport system substrate-binding protein